MATDFLMGRSNLSLGPVNWTFDTGSGGGNVDMGGLRDFTFRFSVEKSDLVYSQYGSKPANRVVTGQDVMIETALAQATLERMTRVIQGFRLNIDTTGTVLGYSYGNAIGEDDLSVAKESQVTRVTDGGDSIDPFDTVTIWKSAPAGQVEMTFDASSQHFVGVALQAYRDDSQVDSEGKGTFFGSGTI